MNHKFHFKNNNSFIYINNTPKLLRISKTPLMNLDKKKINIKKYTNNNNNITNEKTNSKKKPYINLNFNLIQNKNMNHNKIRTITPNLKLREIVNKKFRENNYHNLHNFNNIKCKTEFPDIITNNPNKIQNTSFLQTEANYKKKESIDNMDRQLKLIFVMKNKINELNKIIKEKNQEIINLKSFLPLNNNGNNNNNYSPLNTNNTDKNKNMLDDKNINNIIDNKIENKRMSKDKNNNINRNEYNRFKNNKKDNNNNNKLTPIKKNSEIEKLNKEIQNLNKIISNLDEKYRQEIRKNNEFNQKYNYIKNCTFGNVPTVQIDEKIRNYENKIINLEEQIFQYQQKEKKKKEKLTLSNEEYKNIQICLNALIVFNKIKEEEIMENIDSISFENKEKISYNLCYLLNLSNNNLISNYINDFLIKNKNSDIYPKNFGELITFAISNNNFINNDLLAFLKERCLIYDYNKKGIIPMDYLRHLYDEFCFKNFREADEKELFIIVYTCKNNKNNISSNSLYDIYYENLISNEYEIKFDNNYDDEYEDNEKAVKNFIDSIMNEEIEKLKKREKEKAKELSLSRFNNKNNNQINNTYILNTNLNYDDDFII